MIVLKHPKAMCKLCQSRDHVFTVPKWFASSLRCLYRADEYPRTYAEIRATLSADVFERNTVKAMFYFIRDLVVCTSLAFIAFQLDKAISMHIVLRGHHNYATIIRYGVWVI